MIAFDARAAKALAAGNHLTFDSAPGLRLKATASTRTWLYRYKSPVDDRMRQVRLGRSPTMSPTAALVAWQQAREARAGGADIASRRREGKSDERDRVERARKAKALGDYTVRRLADDYLSSYRGTVTDKTFTELGRLFARELSAIESLPASKLTRTEAFGLIDAMRDRPVVGKRVRQGLGRRRGITRSMPGACRGCVHWPIPTDLSAIHRRDEPTDDAMTHRVSIDG